VCEQAIRFLANPYRIWEKGDFCHKSAVLKLVFVECAVYDRNNRLRTPKTTFPLKWLAGIAAQDTEMVEGAGFCGDIRRKVSASLSCAKPIYCKPILRGSANELGGKLGSKMDSKVGIRPHLLFDREHGR
jgi:hypothetical protein